MIAQLTKPYIKTRPPKVYNRIVSYALFEGRPLTTPGRWINPLVFALLNLSKKMPTAKKVEKPIFILGIGRSGTTLLGTLMSMHKSAGFLNEPKAIWHSLYPYEDLIGNYTDKPAFYRLNEEMASEKIVKEAHKIYGNYLRMVGATRVVDKYPELIFRLGFVREIFPDAKFLFLVRNGWNTCGSIENWSKIKGVRTKNETHDWWGKNNRKWKLFFNEIVSNEEKFIKKQSRLSKIKDHQNMAALEWILTMKEGLKLMEKGTDMLMVKYEDLSISPRKELSKIAAYCELDHDEKFYRYAEEVVKPVPDKQKFTIDPHIAPAFEEMMQKLGYQF